LCHRKATPFLSISMRIGKPRHREEEQPLSTCCCYVSSRRGKDLTVLRLLLLAGKGAPPPVILTAVRSPTGERTHRKENQRGAMAVGFGGWRRKGEEPLVANVLQHRACVRER
jgi:hypothetical protein